MPSIKGISMHNLKIQYPSIKRFKKDLQLIKEKKIFYSAQKTIPAGTQLTIQFTLPGIEQVFKVNGNVDKVLTQKGASDASAKYKGMLISLTEGFPEMFAALKTELGNHEDYKEILGSIVQQDEPLTWEWIRETASQAEFDMEVETAIEDIPPPTTVKKELTPKERALAHSIADFILNMTKAMLRSGYYDPEHPASKTAKKGLFQELQKNTDTIDEIMIAREESRKEDDIIITGVLDEPVSIQNVVGVGKAELFIPKLSEYFSRKSLVSMAIKKNITREHFEAFIDIMCDPLADQATPGKVGSTLTNAMIDKGINEISAVFMDDLIALESSLPWRVEMAIQRLAKDLKVLPMFEGKSEEEIRAMKIQIVEDILRPLRHPNLLADIVINCYLIAMHVKDLDPQDLERTIIDAFPFPILLPTSRFIFKEMEYLIKEQAEHPDNEILKRRLSAIRRILKWTAKRVVLEKAKGAQKFLERLYFNDILSYEELPPEVQYHVNTLKLAKDIRDNMQNYITWIHNVESDDDAIVLFKSFKRAAPFLIEYDAWPTLFEIMKHVSLMHEHFIEKLKLGYSPIIFIFQEDIELLSEAFITGDENQRDMMNSFYKLLGELGITILTRVLEESIKRETRLAAVEVMSSQEELARSWVYKVLDDPQCPWFLHRNALIILCSVGLGDEDVTRTRKYLRHGEPRVRREALKAAIALEAGDKETLIIQCLQDRDELVQKQALNSLRELGTFSEESIRKVLDLLQVEQPGDSEELKEYCRKNIMLIKSLAVSQKPPFQDEIIEILLQLVSHQTEKRKLTRIFKKSAPEMFGPMISSALFGLQRLGDSRTVNSLRELAETESPFTEQIKEAADHLKQQLAKSDSGTE